jgi:hypothetical protein
LCHWTEFHKLEKKFISLALEVKKPDVKGPEFGEGHLVASSHGRRQKGEKGHMCMRKQRNQNCNLNSLYN